MNKYRKLQLAALLAEAATLLVRLVRLAAPLPDWAIRLNGIIMLAACAVLAFASVRVKNS